MGFEGLEYGTARLMGMGAVGETTVFGEAEDLTEIAGDLLGFHVKGAKALDARGVDDPTTAQRNHLREGSGVLTCVVRIGDLCRTQVRLWHQTIDQRGFSHATVAAEKADLSIEQGTQLFHTLARLSRDGATLVAHRLIETDHHLLIM